jgi:multiple sugar transport system substrate-binding protein
MRNLRLFLEKSWLVGILLVLIALTSCSPEVVSEVETPTSTATLARTPTRTVTTTSEAPTATPTQPTMALEIDPDDLDGIVVRFAHPWLGGPAETLDKVAREFSLTNPWGIRVEVYPHGGETDLTESLMNAQVNDDLPNVIAAPAYLRSDLVGDASLVDLSIYVNDPEWGFSADERGDILPVFLESFSIEEEMTVMPFAPQATVLFYNRTWGEALDFSESPRNLDAFRAQSCAATFANWQLEDSAGGTGGWVINLNPRVLASWYYAFGGALPEDDVPLFNNQAGMDAFGYLWDIKNQGCIWFALQPDSYLYFANRFALLYAGQLDQIPVQMSWMEVAGSEDEWEVIGFPGPDGEHILIDGPGLMITAGTPEDELAAWLFTKYLLEPKVQAELVESLFTLPVRESAMDLLADFKVDYPQWAQGAALIESASVLQASEDWGIAQWALQDAVNRILQDESGNVTLILEQLDELIIDLTGSSR